MKKLVIKDQVRFAPDKYQKVDLFGSPYMFFDVYCFEPGQEQQGHAHPGADKVYFVLEGTGHVRVDDESAEIPAGTAVLAPAGSQHSIKNSTKERLVALVALAPRPPAKT